MRVDDAVVGFKMLEFHNHQNLGYEQLHEPLRLTLETEAFWLPVPEVVLDVIGRQPTEVLQAMVHAVLAVARLLTMAERSDLVGSSFQCADEGTGRTVTAILCHDSHPGGLGYSVKAFEKLDLVLDGAVALVDGCRCDAGCPACLGAASAGVRPGGDLFGGARPEKALVAWALRSWREDLAPPEREGTRVGLLAPPAAADRVPWEEAGLRWPEVTARLVHADLFGAQLLARIPAATVAGTRLILELASPGLRDWLAAGRTHQRAMQVIASQVAVPVGWRLDLRVADAARDDALRSAIAIRRRHDDMTDASPATETGADAKLAGGYVTAAGLVREPAGDP
ncbi:MAG: DUF1998 domain-containing protein [Myxococcales bacterium]|nr:DUF1998 domain-containing protein [Myxococcales bacterium]